MYQLRKLNLQSQKFQKWYKNMDVMVRLASTTSSGTNAESGTIKPFTEMPGPPETNSLRFILNYIPLFGGLNLQKVHEIGFKKYKMYGSIRKEKIPRSYNIVIPYDPIDIEKVFRNEGKCPVRPGFNALKYIRRKHKDDYKGNVGIFTDDKDEWYSIRSKTQGNMMRPKVILSYLPELNLVADDMIRLMKYKRQQNLQIDQLLNDLYCWALESLGIFALDQRFGCLNTDKKASSETQVLIEATQKALFGITDSEFGFPLWKYFPTKGWRMLIESQSFLRQLTVQRIADIREKLQTKDEDDSLSFLEQLISDNKLSEGELITFIIDLFMAGIDTTSHSAAFLWYNLAKNPEAQARLYSEIKSIVGNSSNEITASDLEKMKYLKACVKESMRITSSVIGTVRKLDQDIVLSNYMVPKETIIILHSMVAANLERNVEQPHKFIPERWLKDSSASKIHRFAFFPFGYGPRMCIGKRLAEQEIYVLTAKMLLNFEISYEGKMEVITRLVNKPDKPLDFKFSERKE